MTQLTDSQRELYEALTLAGKCHLSNVQCPPELCKAFNLPHGLTWRQVTTLGKAIGGLLWLWSFVTQPGEVAKFIFWRMSHRG